MTAFKWLEDIVKARSLGPWTTTHICAGEEVITGPQYSEHINYYGTAQQPGDACFIATMGTHADLLMDVVRAAEVVANHMHHCGFTSEDPISLGLLERLATALEALKQAKEKK